MSKTLRITQASVFKKSYKLYDDGQLIAQLLTTGFFNINGTATLGE